jgi:SAM-dependent methyltransferase
MSSEWRNWEMFDFDSELARRYGAFTSYQSDASPSFIEYYGENPAAEMDRLLDQYTTSESMVLDIGCGAGQTLCWLAPRVRQIWGLDVNEELLSTTRLRAKRFGLANTRCVLGSADDPEAMKCLPDATFDLAFSRRGPKFSKSLLRTLRKEAIFVQEVVSNLDGYPLGEIFGRRYVTPFSASDQEVLLSGYADLGLFPVSCKEYFYEEFYRDHEHFAAFLTQVTVMLSPWLLPQSLPRKPYDSLQDQNALDLYMRYNMTEKGIRVLRQCKILVLRRAGLNY